MPDILIPASARAGNTSAPSIAVIGSGEMSVVLQTAGYTPLPNVSVLTVAAFCQCAIKKARPSCLKGGAVTRRQRYGIRSASDSGNPAVRENIFIKSGPFPGCKAALRTEWTTKSLLEQSFGGLFQQASPRHALVRKWATG